MLEELSIRDVGVIDEATLRFGPGLNVLTGETGAGKTMVVQALELLLGARAGAEQVRHGAATAIVDGLISPVPAAAAEWAEDESELIVSREVSAEDSGARSRARINGRMAPASALSEALRGTIEVHGQHESVRLAEPALQRELLDRCGGETLQTALAAYRETWVQWHELNETVQLRQRDADSHARELDLLRFEVAELEGAAPQVGEGERLLAELARLEHAEALTHAAAAAAAALSSEGGARDALGTAVAALRAIAGVDQALDELLARGEALAAESQDLAMELDRYAGGLELDSARLEALRQRQAQLAELTWKYGDGQVSRGSVDSDLLVARLDASRARLQASESGEEDIATLRARLAELEQALGTAAKTLHDERVAAGERLAHEVEGHLAELAMAGARLEVRIEAAAPGPHGGDKVEFFLAANPGEPALPLGRAASGGERSRVALAVRLALADADDTAVLVFDEVDAGIGGAVAQAVGKKLAQLARGRQVLCVTHLAQLAAFADVHFVVDKVAKDGRTVATVQTLDETDRVVELSRMLSGSPDSELAVGHAAELREAALAARG